MPNIRIHPKLTDRAAEEAGLSAEEVAARRQQQHDQATHETAAAIDSEHEKRRPGKAANRVA